MQQINLILFDNFTALDAFGPAEVFAKLPDRYSINYYSRGGGPINNSIGAPVQTQPIGAIQSHDILLVPGGFGTRSLVNDPSFITLLQEIAQQATQVLTVCTGSALLAKTGLLDNRQATSNKLAFDWVVSQGPAVHWIRQARWVVDGKFYTSSGISAGIDMALGYIADTSNPTAAQTISRALEYQWIEDKTLDPFS